MDSHLAKLFKIETENLNKSMKRNIERFPKEFCFVLTNDEYSLLLFQIGIAKRKGGRTNLPYAYTEQAVAMISSMLHSKEAIGMSIAIINAFVKMRHFIIQNKDVHQALNNINNTLSEHSKKKIIYFLSLIKRKSYYQKINHLVPIKQF